MFYCDCVALTQLTMPTTANRHPNHVGVGNGLAVAVVVLISIWHPKLSVNNIILASYSIKQWQIDLEREDGLLPAQYVWISLWVLYH